MRCSSYCAAQLLSRKPCFLKFVKMLDCAIMKSQAQFSTAKQYLVIQSKVVHKGNWKNKHWSHAELRLHFFQVLVWGSWHGDFWRRSLMEQVLQHLFQYPQIKRFRAQGNSGYARLVPSAQLYAPSNPHKPLSWKGASNWSRSLLGFRDVAQILVSLPWM